MKSNKNFLVLLLAIKMTTSNLQAHCGFMVEKVEVGQIFLLVLRFVRQWRFTGDLRSYFIHLKPMLHLSNLHCR